jgi:hypothetical protein
MISRTCDICKQPKEVAENILIGMLGGVKLDIKLGIYKQGEGDICVDCARQILKDVVEKGVFRGRLIEMPADYVPLVAPAAEVKLNYSLTHK